MGFEVAQGYLNQYTDQIRTIRGCKCADFEHRVQITPMSIQNISKSFKKNSNGIGDCIQTYHGVPFGP